MPRARIDTAVILAAGAGTRFWPYNVVRQKAAFPIAGTPMVRRLVDDLAALGIQRVVVVVGAGEASVRAALRGSASQIHYMRQPELRGTAAAALAGMQAVEGPCLVLAGDVVTERANLAAMLDAWKGGDSPAMALVQPLGDELPQSWLVAHVDDGALVGVEGHPRGGSLRLAGMFAFDPSVCDYLRDNPGLMTQVPVGGMPPLEAELAQSLQMMIDEGLPVAAVSTVGFHVDVDKPWHILQANQAVLASLFDGVDGQRIGPGSTIHDGATIEGRVVMGANCRIGDRAVLRGDVWLDDGAVIDNGAIVDGRARVGAKTQVRDYALIGGDSSLGPLGTYGHGAEFSGVALDRVYCYHYCEIWGVVGSAVDFGAATVCGNLRFDDGQTPLRVKGRVEVPTVGANAAYFGDYARTGVNAIIMPGRRIGAYAVVGAGVVLYDDLEDRQLLLLKQDLIKKPWGPERYGW